MIKNKRGSVLLEGLPVMGVIVAFVLGILLVVYTIFGRAWIQFQSEQALYCLSEKTPAHECQVKLEAKLDQFLPWGKWRIQLQGKDGNWNVRVQWKIGKFGFVLAKNLDTEAAAKSAASPL